MWRELVCCCFVSSGESQGYAAFTEAREPKRRGVTISRRRQRRGREVDRGVRTGRGDEEGGTTWRGLKAGLDGWTAVEKTKQKNKTTPSPGGRLPFRRAPGRWRAGSAGRMCRMSSSAVGLWSRRLSPSFCLPTTLSRRSRGLGKRKHGMPSLPLLAPHTMAARSLSLTHSPSHARALFNTHRIGFAPDAPRSNTNTSTGA